MVRTIRRVVPALAGLLLLAACATVPPDDDAPPSAAASLAPSDGATADREGRLGGRLADDGTIPLDLALDLFAAAFGPIPGGDPGALEPVGASGSMAVRGVLAHWDELDSDQQAAVEAALAGGSDASATGAAAPAPAGSLAAIAPAALPAASTEEIRGITALVEEMRAALSDRLGIPLAVPITTSAQLEPRGAGVAAATWPMARHRFVTGGRMDACHIAVYPPGIDAVGTETFRTMIAHEVMHCFQYDHVPDVAQVTRGPQWIVEGSATFASLVVAPDAAQGAHWHAWLVQPAVPLYKRSYAAVGAFAVAEQTGADVWERMLPMLGEDHTGALELLFGTTARTAMIAIAQALVREPGLGPAWESTGPSIPSGGGGLVLTARPGEQAVHAKEIKPFATTPLLVDADGEVIDVVVGEAVGTVGAPGGRADPIGAGFVGRYCVAGRCTCADGAPVGGWEIPSDGRFGVALTTTGPPGGPGVDATVRVTVLTTEEACATRPAGDVLVVRFSQPEVFEVHGGLCVVQDSGDLLVQAWGGHLPEDYRRPPEHRDDVELSLYKNPTTPAEAGTGKVVVGGAVLEGGSWIVPAPDGLSGTFALDSGYAGEWVCAELLTPDQAYG